MVINLVDRITRRMRKAGRTGRTVVLRLRFDDFGRVTRSHTMPRATASTDAILAAAREPGRGGGAADRRTGPDAGRLRGVQHRPRRRPAAGAAVRANIADTVAIDGAVDEVRRRYGNAAVTRGVLLGRDPGLEMPQLPD